MSTHLVRGTTWRRSSTETIKRPSGSLQCIYNIESSDCLSLGVFSIGDRVSDNIFQEDLEDTACFFVNEPRDTLDTTTTSKTTNGRFGYALDVITKDFAMAFGTTFPKTLAAFSTPRHCKIG